MWNILSCCTGLLSTISTCWTITEQTNKGNCFSGEKLKKKKVKKKERKIKKNLENLISDPRISVKKFKILIRILKGKYNRESRPHACIQLFISVSWNTPDPKWWRYGGHSRNFPVLHNEWVQGQLSLLTVAQHFPCYSQCGCSEISLRILALPQSTPAAELIRLSREVALDLGFPQG